MRDEPPTDDEVDQIGEKTSLLIFRLLLQLRSGAGTSGTDREDALEIICKFLKVNKSQVNKSSGSVTFDYLKYFEYLLRPIFSSFVVGLA